MALKSVTLRLDGDLHETLCDYARVTDTKVQDVIGAALREEMEKRLKSGGKPLRDVLDSMGYADVVSS